MKIEKNYLNFPVSQNNEREKMNFKINNNLERVFDIKLSSGQIDYWVFSDVSQYKGKEIVISYPESCKGLDVIYQSDTVEGENNMYKEINRPRAHFTSRRGWLSDTNGLVYFDGEYHLFYQHNPYEHLWGNMHWGHAVSKDLIHWEELPVALYPDSLGMVYSGSMVVDYSNTTGFGSAKNPAMVAVYTSSDRHKQVQCLAYSTDRGRTWTKYDNNPVLDTKHVWKHKATRDPKVFWYEPNENWVMLLFELDGFSIYTSLDLKNWKYESHVTGFWECPELFELPVDNNPEKKRWVMQGASGTYMIGSFDGKSFIPEAGKYLYTTGSAYAAQTFNDIPKLDGRRIQIAWGRVYHQDMPFSGQMLIPTELTLKTTKDGIRLFSNPIEEFSQLNKKELKWVSLTSEKAAEKLNSLGEWDCLRLKMKLSPFLYYKVGLKLDGQDIIFYDMNFNQVNGVFYSPDNITGMGVSLDIIIDRTSIEVFVDGGAYSYSFERKSPYSNSKRYFEFVGEQLTVDDLTVYDLKSIW